MVEGCGVSPGGSTAKLLTMVLHNGAAEVPGAGTSTVEHKKVNLVEQL